MARHIRSGDQVMVIAGADKGKTGKVLRIIPDRQRVVVEGINRVWKHVRPSQRHPQGGRIQKDAPIHLSNVMPIDPSSSSRPKKPKRMKRKRPTNPKHGSIEPKPSATLPLPPAENSSGMPKATKSMTTRSWP